MPDIVAGLRRAGVASIVVVFGLPAAAQPSLNFYGLPGLIDMPSGQSMADGDLGVTLSGDGAFQRASLSFQITPRLSGSFRYSRINDFDAVVGEDRFDRSFDLQYRVMDEGRIRPSVVVGLQDFIGSSIYAGEYVAASKTLGPNVVVTGGLGWGRYGTYNGFSNPLGGISDSFKTRPTDFDPVEGQQVLANKWFRGDMALFGGVEWRTPVDNLTLKAEYSSDAYIPETNRGLLERKSPLNFGAEYKYKNTQIGLYYRYGSEVGLKLSTTLNPNRPLAETKITPPLPFNVRGRGDVDLSGDRDELHALLQQEGIQVEALNIQGRRAILRYRNDKYDLAPQAIGRTARAMTHIMPPHVEEFVLIPLEQGLGVSAIAVTRSDLETGGEALAVENARVSPAADYLSDLPRAKDLYPEFSGGISPFARAHLFDPDDPLRIDIGLRAEGRVNLMQGLSVSGSATKRLIGNIDNNTRESDSVLQRVRSDVNKYQTEGDPVIEDLTADLFMQFGPSLYGRASVGYLEQMYGGASAEILYKPHASRFALGAEINLVKQRDFDQLLGFQDYSTVTGHASAYWDFGNGYQAQVDAGRYLAKDWGATVGFDRTFKNGWQVGAYATLTDVSFDDFGEGKFDKGIRMRIPLSWAIGEPSRDRYNVLLQPVYRDGGARLNVKNRLYDVTKDADRSSIFLNWDKFSK